MATYAKIINGLTDLGMHKMQEHLDFYIERVNKGELTFSQALDELIEIEQQNNRVRAENACVMTAAFPFIKTMDEFDFSFQPSINRNQLLELNNLGFVCAVLESYSDDALFAVFYDLEGLDIAFVEKNLSDGFFKVGCGNIHSFMLCVVRISDSCEHICDYI